MKAYEFNFDGLVGPTHNYAGLSLGNVASVGNAFRSSSPRKAAEQGLQKMKFLHDMGVKQAILPPQDRPAIHVLRQLGFSGDDAAVIRNAGSDDPELFLNCCSASAMWVANAATVSPAADTGDDRVHLTPANLSNKFHRSIEHPTTRAVFAAIFRDHEQYVIHQALPAGAHFSDEGAANHIRLCARHADPGLEIFVYGQRGFGDCTTGPRVFPARQTLEASQAVARRHQLEASRTLFVQQNPAVIDAGVFHNDVIAVGNGPVLLFHEKAFAGKEEVLTAIVHALEPSKPIFVEVQEEQVDVATAVQTYLFNSQLLTINEAGDMIIIAPEDCRENQRVSACLQAIVADTTNPIKAIHFFDLRESMQNGGGPACLRLRVVLDESGLQGINPGVLFSQSLYKKLTVWIVRNYRDKVDFDDLMDPQLLIESRQALDELTSILNIGPVYPFQL